MSSKKWMTMWVGGSAGIMVMLYSMIHAIEKEQVLMEYQLSKIHEKLDLHTEKLEILDSKLDQLIKKEK
jgi:hypothetical protein